MAKASQIETLVKNALVSTLQIGLSAAIALLTIRLLLRHLGFVDYGLLTALGASGFYSVVFSTGVNLAALRHMSFELGRPNKGKLVETFSVTMAVYFVMGLGMIGIGLALQSSIFAALTIPPERMQTASYVYVFVLAGMGLSSIAAPYSALRLAHQHMVAFSVYQLTNQVLVLVLLLLIPFLNWDALLLVSGGTFMINLVVQSILIIHCWFAYPDVRPSFRLVNFREAWRVLKFAKWSMLGMLAFQMNSQLALVVMNIQFGLIVNAAYALANSVNGLLMRLQGSVHRALQPAITTNHAKGDLTTFSRMVSIGSRYSVFFILPAIVPLMWEMETVLGIWVGQYPEQAPLFARLVILTTGLSLSVAGYGMAVNALDRMAENTMIFAPIQFGAFAVCTLGVFYFNWAAWSLPASAVFAILLQIIVYPMYFGKACDFSSRRWFVECVLPMIAITLIGLGFAAIPSLFLGSGFVRLILSTGLSGASLAIAIWLIGIRADEKKQLTQLVRQKFRQNAVKSGRSEIAS